MNRIRRPWTLDRRDTDGVQMKALEYTGKTADEAKTIGPHETIDPIDVEQGHLEEIEVDVEHVFQDREQRDIEGDTSPYPSVRAVVPETDDVTIPVNTLRMWLLGTIWTLLGAGVIQFFSLRYPAVHIVSIVAELMAYHMGIALAKILPIMTVQLPYFGEWPVNPDHYFNIKEHVVVVIMSNVCIGFAGGADGTNIIQAAIKFYGFDITPGFSVMVVLVCQVLGFGVAGLCHSFLVEPVSIIWPGVLGNVAMLTNLHSRASAVANGWKISRIRFFIVIMVGAFVWYWFPGLIFTALSYFTFICWAAPNNIVVNQLFGIQTGLGMSPITFDWSQIAYNTNPLL